MSRVPHEHSFRKARAPQFLRVETRSTRLSLGARSSRFGTVSARSYWQALAGPFMVELFTAECFAPSPTPVRSASPLAELKAPHASRVERAPWPEPLGRDLHPLCAITASMRGHRGFSLSPRLGGEPGNPGLAETRKRPRFGIAESRLSDRTPGLGPSTSRGFTPMSLRRAGRARLHAPSSTGHTCGGWLVPPP